METVADNLNVEKHKLNAVHLLGMVIMVAVLLIMEAVVLKRAVANHPHVLQKSLAAAKNLVAQSQNALKEKKNVVNLNLLVRKVKLRHANTRMVKK